MKYIFRGNLKAYLCDDCIHPLHEVNVLLYKIQDQQRETLRAVANTKETFHQVSAEEAAGKKDQLLASAITDEKGNFSIELDERQYNGGAFDIDFECGTVPIKWRWPKPPKKLEKPLQFHLTTLQPLWKEDAGDNKEKVAIAGWEYAISARWFCWILRLLRYYIICGRLVDCKHKRALPNIRVEAFDVDLIQDDALGSDITDSAGHFFIVYDEASFSKTIFSWLNVEWPAGPDIYFKFYDAATNGLIYAEPRSTGHRSDRENRNNCWCVELCIDLNVPPDTGKVPAYFNAVGQYLIATDFNASGRTNNAEDNVFTGVLPLNGNLPPAYATNAIEYRFKIQRLNRVDGVTVIEEFIPRPENASTGLIKPTLIGSVTRYVVPPLPDPVYTVVEPYYLNNPGATHNVSIGAQGWIKVPRAENNWSTGMYQFNYPGAIVSLANLDTTQLIVENFDLNAPSVHVAGNTMDAADRFAGPDHIFKIICESREVSAISPNPNPISQNVLAKINVLNGMTSFQLTRHPGWAGGVGTYKGVCMMEIQETVGNGCGKVNNEVHILYTCYHPYIADAHMYIEGPGGNFGALSPAINVNHEASGSHLVDLTGKPNCAYIAWLTTHYRITSGYGRLSNNYDQDHIAFCKG